VASEQVRYFCENGKVKYILKSWGGSGEEKTYLVLGDVEDLLQNCGSMMSKTTG
jgi:hypothetical protein